MSAGPTRASRSMRSTISGGVTRNGTSPPPGYGAQPAAPSSRSPISAPAVLGFTRALGPMLSAIISSLHLLALAIGLPAVFLRGRALKGPLDADGLRRLLASDSAWGIAALLWIVTGLLRAFGGLGRAPGSTFTFPPSWAKLAPFLLFLWLRSRRWLPSFRCGASFAPAGPSDPSPPAP